MLQFEYDLAFHCAPALAGIKPANLMSCSNKTYPDLDKLLQEYRKTAIAEDIRFSILCSCPHHSLLLVYRQTALEEWLQRPDVAALLVKEGYPVDKGVSEMLAHLGVRLAQCSDFPHEIGLFLGYPPADVLAFRHFRGQNYKFCGYWKVYNNEEEALRWFQRFDLCRDCLCLRLKQGMTIPQLFTCALSKSNYCYAA